MFVMYKFYNGHTASESDINLQKAKKEEDVIMDFGGIIKKLIKRVLWILAIIILGIVLCVITFEDKDQHDIVELEQQKQEAQATEVVETSKENASQKEDATAVGSAAVNRNNTDIDAILPSNPDYDDFLHVGEKYGFKNGGSMEILDAGYGFGVVYVLVELTSGDDESMQFDQSDATLYINDYEVSMGGGEEGAIDNGYIYVSGDTSYPAQARVNAGGRKASMVFVADIPSEIPENAEIEFEIAGGIFKINPLTTGKAKQNLDEAWGITDEEENRAGIGNPVIDANPDRYVLTEGYIDTIDEGFYADSGNIDLVPGLYCITGGGNEMLNITENAISMSGGKNDFENAEIKPAENMAPQYWVSIDGTIMRLCHFLKGDCIFGRMNLMEKRIGMKVFMSLWNDLYELEI